MLPIHLAFLYNVRHTYPDPDDPRGMLEADFDDPETIEGIKKYLGQIVKEVTPIEANEESYLELYKIRKEVDLAFNYSEGIYGDNREAHLPAFLEMLQIPYTGSDVLTQSLGFNKDRTKEVMVVNNISTPPFVTIRPGEEIKIDFNKLPFPLMVKPAAQGSSAGITNKSVVRDEAELKERVKWVHDNFKQSAIVELFLTGREFSVGMIGNPPEILPIIESDHSNLPEGYFPMDSLEVKWIFEEQGGSGDAHLICPAKMSPELEKKVKDICLQQWNALEIKDWCRVDIRCDANENPYFLEVNSPAGMLPPEVSTTSYFPLAARTAGIDYPNLLKKIIETALQRYGKEVKDE